MTGVNGRHLRVVAPLSDFLRDLDGPVAEPQCNPVGRLIALDRDNAACYQLIVELIRRFENGEIDEESFRQDHHDLWDMSIAIARSTGSAFDEYMVAEWRVRDDR